MRSKILELLAYATQIILNAIVGFLFMRTLAYYYGASALKDAIDLTYAIPFIVLRTCGFTMIHGAVVNHFTSLRKNKSTREYSDTFSELLCDLSLIIIGLCSLVIIFRASITDAIAPGFENDTRQATIHLLVGMIPLAIWFCLGTVLSAVLISFKIKIGAEIPQIASRILTIAALLASGSQPSIATITLCLNAGAALSVGLLGLSVWKYTPINFAPKITFRNKDVNVILSSLPSLFNHAVLAQVAFLVMQRMASLIGPGSIATLNYSLGIAAPLSLIIGKPLSLSYGPTLNKLINDKAFTKAKSLTGSLIIITFIISIPACILFSMRAEQLIGLLIGGGSFDSHAISETASLTKLTVWGLPAAIICWITQPTLLLLPKLKYRGFILCGGYLLQIIFLFVFNTQYGLIGLTISYLIAIYTQSLLATGALLLTLHSKDNGVAPST